MIKGITVLSLFDGMSCGQIALEKAGIKVKNYYASEIKQHAIKCAKINYPNTIHIGDVTKITYNNGILYTEFGEYNLGKIDLLIGGSPCQDFSVLNMLCQYKDKQALGLKGEKSKLFYEYLRLKNEINPTYFLLENVKMKKESEKELNNYLGVEGVHINSSLVSFQRRPRIYWSNIPNISQPEDRNISFQDYKDSDFKYCLQFKLNKTPSRERMWNNGFGRTNIKSCDNITNADKIGCLTKKQDRSPNSGLIEFDGFARYLTTRELELAQTVPVGYTNCVTKNQAEDLLGDGWTVDIIAHIFSNLKEM